MELLVRGMVFVQVNDVLHHELLRQCRRPALQFEVGQQQWVAVLVDGALGQAQYATGGVCLCPSAFELELLRPHTHALYFAHMMRISAIVDARFSVIVDGISG